MSDTRSLSLPGSLVGIGQLLHTEVSLQPGDGSPDLCVTDNYQYSSIDKLNPSTRAALSSLIERTQAEGFILPRDGSSFSLIPLRGPLCSVVERASSQILWRDAVSLVPAFDLKLLFTHGVLGLKLAQGVVSGPAAHVLIASKDGSTLPDTLTTDPLSEAALSHISRLPLTDPMVLSCRLYTYNSLPGFRSRSLVEATCRVREIVESNWSGIFRVRTPSPQNPGWYLFGNAKRNERRHSTPHNVKVYISPIVADVPRCLSRLVEILPSLQFNAWKIGRHSYGLTRCDKICVYFDSREHAHSAAQVFVEELRGIEAHGVPFTERQDSTGLISVGIDPDQSSKAPSFAMQSSWRLWLARKMGAAMALAKTSPNYPLSPEQAALWAVHLLGVDPLSWTIRDLSSWRT